MLQKTKITLLTAAMLLCNQALADLSIVNPQGLKEKYTEGKVNAKMSNIGVNSYQKGTTRMGQVITPFNLDGQGCEPFDWDKDFTVEEM